MGRRAARDGVDELRARYLANREKVRSWLADWDCPEVEWPPVEDVPSSCGVGRGGAARWLDRHAPFLQEYRWFLEGRPRAEGVSQAWAWWQFGAGHEFERLEVEFRSYADPPYLAEKLALAADAAALKGWRRDGDDVQALYAWLLEGLDSRPMDEMVHGNKRTGFVLFDILRSPHPTNEVSARLRMTLTTTALDGTPLDEHGEARPS